MKKRTKKAKKAFTLTEEQIKQAMWEMLLEACVEEPDGEAHDVFRITGANQDESPDLIDRLFGRAVTTQSGFSNEDNFFAPMRERYPEGCGPVMIAAELTSRDRAKIVEHVAKSCLTERAKKSILKSLGVKSLGVKS